jgi:hypothetical protein
MENARYGTHINNVTAGCALPALCGPSHHHLCPHSRSDEKLFKNEANFLLIPSPLAQQTSSSTFFQCVSAFSHHWVYWLDPE